MGSQGGRYNSCKFPYSGIIASTANPTVFVADPVDHLPGHRATGLLGGLHAGVHGGTADHVDAGDGELVLLGVVQ